MSTQARDMYQEEILDHYRHPRCFGLLPSASHSQELNNPLCGDKIAVYLRIENDVIEQARFTGQGCAISMAAASMLMESLEGMAVRQAKALTKDDILELLHIPVGPVRLKCALLAWDTLQQALNNEVTIDHKESQS